jgi:hypothetical protein
MGISVGMLPKVGQSFGAVGHSFVNQVCMRLNAMNSRLEFAAVPIH